MSHARLIAEELRNTHRACWPLGRPTHCEPLGPANRVLWIAANDGPAMSLREGCIRALAWRTDDPEPPEAA